MIYNSCTIVFFLIEYKDYKEVSMINFLVYHGSEPGDDFGNSSGYYRVQYSSKEKLKKDLAIAILNAIEKKENGFNFLEIQMQLSDFYYIGAFYNDFEAPFECDDISIITLDEWFNEEKVGTENIHKIHDELIFSQVDLIDRNNERLLKFDAEMSGI